MKKWILIAGLCLGNAAIIAQNDITLQADKGKDIINKNIYGHFAEHLGHCIYGGLYVGDNNTKIPNKDGDPSRCD
jgi:alpha-N-arabinofuranosidase